jgi:uncharacterized metal-binding protein
VPLLLAFLSENIRTRTVLTLAASVLTVFGMASPWKWDDRWMFGALNRSFDLEAFTQLLLNAAEAQDGTGTVVVTAADAGNSGKQLVDLHDCQIDIAESSASGTTSRSAWCAASAAPGQRCAPRTTFLLRGGKLQPLLETSMLGLPTDWTSLIATRAFSWRGKLRMTAEALISPADVTADESIASFVRRRFLVFSYPGCSFAGKLADSVARELDQQQLAEMSCLAGVGAKHASFLRKLPGRPVWIIDGCPIECARGVFEQAQQMEHVTRHVRLHDMGFKKTRPPVEGVDVAKLAQRVAS